MKTIKPLHGVKMRLPDQGNRLVIPSSNKLKINWGVDAVKKQVELINKLNLVSLLDSVNETANAIEYAASGKGTDGLIQKETLDSYVDVLLRFAKGTSKIAAVSNELNTLRRDLHNLATSLSAKKP
jgi:hypothetical protein